MKTLDSAVNDIKRKPASALQWACSLILTVAATLAAATPAVHYTALDLPDTDPAHDLWRYTYTIGGSLPTDFGLNIVFPTATFGDMDITGPDPGLMVSITPGIAGFADGLVSVVALRDISTASPAVLSIDFQWNGAGAGPGSQSFESFDDQFSIVGQGITVPQAPVPEPPMAILVCAGLLAFATRHAIRASFTAPSSS